jgi:glycosyltransferase involved in cell wall biosynthesis
MYDADVLVNLGNDTPYQLPSKVVEYLAAGKPVLNIASRPDDSPAAFFSQYGIALCLLGGSGEWSAADVDRAAEFVARAAKAGNAAKSQQIEFFSASRIASEYLRLLRERGQTGPRVGSP